MAIHPALVLTGPPRLILGVQSGRLDLMVARAKGLEFEGDVQALTRVRPTSLPDPAAPSPLH